MQHLDHAAICDFQDFDPERHARCLSPEETIWLGGFRNQGRRRQSLCARLCLKYLLLLESRSSVQDPLIKVEEYQLSYFPEALYRKISFVVDGSNSGMRKLLWFGTVPAGVKVSIAHARSMCGAALAVGRSVGMDVEFVEQRSESFYRTYFSEAEQVWVQTRNFANRSWLFTILWSLKECAVKMQGCGFSELSQIMLNRFPGDPELKGLFESRVLPLAPTRFSIEVARSGGMEALDCELTGTPHMVVAVARRSGSRQGR